MGQQQARYGRSFGGAHIQYGISAQTLNRLLQNERTTYPYLVPQHTYWPYSYSS